MPGVQTLLISGSILLFSITIIGVNSFCQDLTVETENKKMLTAFSLADDMIEEIRVRSFDENTLKLITENVSSLTPLSSFGSDIGEDSLDIRSFDDIDDFEGYTRSIKISSAENYCLKCDIRYVFGDNPDAFSTEQTFYKKISIKVSSSLLKNSINLSDIVTLK